MLHLYNPSNFEDIMECCFLIYVALNIIHEVHNHVLNCSTSFGSHNYLMYSYTIFCNCLVNDGADLFNCLRQTGDLTNEL